MLSIFLARDPSQIHRELLGIDPHQEAYDQQNRPFQLSKGNPIPLEVS